MPDHFHRTVRALQLDRPAGSVMAAAIAVGLLAVWCGWAHFGRVTRYVVSESARLEIEQAAVPVQSPLAGRVVESRLELGREVQEGDVLAVLESDAERLGLAEERTRVDALTPQILALQKQLEAHVRGQRDDDALLEAQIAEARSRHRDAQALATLAEQEAERTQKLRAAGVVAVAEEERARANAQSRRAAAENLRLAIERLTPEWRVRHADRDARREQIEQELARLQSQRATGAAAIRTLQHQVQRRVVRASMAGRLTECATLRPGAWVAEGEQLGVVLPARSGSLRMVAAFDPRDAMGKVRPGQSAIIRLQGFPWAQYGTVQAQVSRVAGELRDGKVRVELAVSVPPGSRIPLQHGMPGTAEILAEQISPLQLLLRTAGARLAGQS